VTDMDDRDNGMAWQVRAGEVFTEDALLCGGSLTGARMCIRLLGADMRCEEHGERRRMTTAAAEPTREQRIQTTAQVLHERRHPLGSAPSCGRCRADAQALAHIVK
jgi:hypothetical protein